MKNTKLIYIVATGVLSLIYVSFGTLCTLKHPSVVEEFGNLGLPTHFLVPLGVLKLSAVVVLWIQKKSILKEWVYSAMFFNIVVALYFHIVIRDGEYAPALFALTLLFVSYFYGRKRFGVLV